VNEKKDIEENNNSNSKEPTVTDPNTDTSGTKGDTESSKERNRLPNKQRQEFIKANIITVITALTAITVAFFFITYRDSVSNMVIILHYRCFIHIQEQKVNRP
jgi:hypothetical protein